MENTDFSVMEKKVTFSWLLAFYGEMLTENQREMSRLHWEEDLTFAEIAQQFSVSRQSVHDTVARVEKQLSTLEEKLGLVARFRAVEDGLQRCRTELDSVSATPETQKHLAAAKQMISQLLDQEER